MDLSNMLNMFSKNNNQEQIYTPPTSPTNNMYPELLDIQNSSQQKIETQNANAPQKNQSNANLPFNLNPDMLKMIQQILPLLTNNSGNGNNMLSTLLGGSNPLNALFNKKSPEPSPEQNTETNIDDFDFEDLIKVDDF